MIGAHKIDGEWRNAHFPVKEKFDNMLLRPRPDFTEHGLSELQYLSIK